MTGPSPAPPPEDLFDDIARLLEPGQREYFYQRMLYFRHLRPEDELLRLVEAIGLLALLIREAPHAVARERAQMAQLLETSVATIQAAGEAGQAYQRQLDGRLTRLPADLAQGISPEAIARAITESLRQQFVQSGLPATADALTALSQHLTHSTSQFQRAASQLSDCAGIAERAQGAIDRVTTSVANATDTARSAFETLRQEFSLECLRAVCLLCGAAWLVGVFGGIVFERWWGVGIQVVPQMIAVPAPSPSPRRRVSRRRRSPHQRRSEIGHAHRNSPRRTTTMPSLDVEQAWNTTRIGVEQRPVPRMLSRRLRDGVFVRRARDVVPPSGPHHWEPPMLTIRAMSNERGYAANHLVHSDYYAEGQRVVGYWRGRGAAELGLVGEVTEAQFEAIRQGLHPGTAEALRPRQSADRLSEDGEILSRGRHLYDFTLSAPKSLSIMAALAEDDRLVQTHQRAVEAALQELEASAAARVRMEGANENRRTGNLVLAVYRHDTSRELDPQLHTHAVAGNLTYDGTEGRWKALQASDIYAQRAYLTEVYRNTLAYEVRALGYDIDDQHDARGRDVGFEIRGVSQALLRTYSQRSQQRDQAIEAFTQQTGRRPTDNEVAVLVRVSRPDKLMAISTAEVTHRQLARLTPEEAQSLTELRQQAFEAAREREGLAVEPAAPALRCAEQHLFERRSVVQEHEVLAETLRQGRGRIALADAKGVLALEESSGALLRVGYQVATRESLDRERQMIAAINRGIGAFDRLGGDHVFLASDRLRPEQQHAVHQVLASRDWAVNLRGAAGTGKTATLQELRRGLAESGHDVLAVAPTRSAVHELQQVGLSQAMTIQRLLVDSHEQARLRKRVLIVDEAGMVSARQMTTLLELAEQHAARVVFSGDTRQLQSVEAGDALRILERESGLRSVSLTQVQRQTPQSYRQAIEALREHPARGFAHLEQMGVVREVAWADRSRSVAAAWLEAQAHLNWHGQPSSVLVVCATHEDIAHVTAAIRAERDQRGELGEGVVVDRYVPLHYTLAQKGDPRQFHAGQVLVFHHATPAVNRHEALEIVRVEPHQLVARTESGEEHVVTATQAQAFDVYERRPIEIAPHDRLLLTANRQESGLRVTNGEMVTVSQVDARGRLQLEDGRMIPSTSRQFDYGYAVTAHRSQGQSVDAVVIAGETMSRELFYVAASRGRERLTVITSDKARLEESAGQSGARLSASELVRTMHARLAEGLRPDGSGGFERGIRAVVEGARQSVGFERDAHRHTVPGPVQQQAIQPAVNHEREAPAQRLAQGHGLGIS